MEENVEEDGDDSETQSDNSLNREMIDAEATIVKTAYQGMPNSKKV